jgi:hypothetical protein
MLRATIHELAGIAAVQGEIVQRYAALKNDAGLEFALRCLAAYTKAALETLEELKAENAKETRDERLRV